MAKKQWLSTVKFEIALLALKGESTFNEIGNKYQVAPSQINKTKI